MGPKDVSDPPVPEIVAYEEAIRPQVAKRLGPRVHLVNPIVGTVFPNFSFLRAHLTDLPRLAATGAGQDRSVVMGLCG